MTDNTFLGLQPYTEDDAYRFKGRTEESQELFRLIACNDFTVCYAESGEGKTSLLNAGVFPLLRENMYFPISITFTSDDYIVTPDSFDAIIDRCIKNSIYEYNEKNKGVNVEYKLCSTDFQGLDFQIDLQRELSEYSWWKLRNYRPQAMGLTFIPVFVFDQFEEVFNLPGSIVWTKKFFDWLEVVSSDSCPDLIVKKVREIIGDKVAFPTIKEEKDFKAVFSLRKEFIGELDYWGMQKCFIPAIKNNRYCLKALTYEGGKKVMMQQVRFAEDKVEQVLNYFVKNYSREPEKTIEERLPAIPALLLSVVCISWEKDIDYFACVDESSIGQSLNKILEWFYNETMDSAIKELSRQSNDTSIVTLRNDIDSAMFALVDVNGKRVRTKTTSSTLMEIGFDAKYKNVLSDRRIIRIIKIDGEDYVELIHDALCPVIIKNKERRNKEKEQTLIDQERKERTRREKLQMAQSRYIAGVAERLVIEGDSYLARRLLLEVLPQYTNNHQDRLYTFEAESIFRKAASINSAILKGHTDRVNSATFSPDGKSIVSASSDKTIRIWVSMTGQQIGNALEGHTDRVNYAEFSPDGKCIVSASNDRTIRIWDAMSGQQIGNPLIGHKKSVNFAAFSPDGELVVSASADKTLRIWDVKTGKQIGKPLIGHTNNVKSVVFNHDGKRIVSASTDKTIRIWDSETGQQIGSLWDGSSDGVNYATFCPNGKRIVSALLNKVIQIWECESDQNYCTTINGHNGVVLSASFSPDGEKIISASSDHTIGLWDAKTGQQIGHFLEGHLSSVNYAAFSPDGKLIASSSNDQTVRIWDIVSAQQVGNPIIEHKKSVFSVAFSPDGKQIVSASADKTIRIWDVDTKQQIVPPLKGHLSNVNHAAFSSDGKLIVSASNDSTIRIWDANTGRQLGEPLRGHTDWVNYAAFSPDGKRIVSASADKTIRFWNTQTGQPDGTPLVGHNRSVNFVTFSPDGTCIISASQDGTIRIWDSETGRPTGIIFLGQAINVHSAVFCPDGKRIVSALSDSSIRIWDAKTGRQIGKTLEGHSSSVNFATFSPDGKYIVSSSFDKTIRIWDSETGRQVGDPLEGHISWVYSVDFSSDGKHIVSGSGDNTIRIWEFLPMQELIDQMRERYKNYPLTIEERSRFYIE